MFFVFFRNASSEKPSTNGDRSNRASTRPATDSQPVNAKNPNVADIPDTESIDPKRTTTKGLQRVNELSVIGITLNVTADIIIYVFLFKSLIRIYIFFIS